MEDKVKIPVELKKTGKITFNESGKGSLSGRLTIPVDLLKLMGIDKQNRDVEITFKDGKIIIEKDITSKYY